MKKSISFLFFVFFCSGVPLLADLRAVAGTSWASDSPARPKIVISHLNGNFVEQNDFVEIQPGDIITAKLSYVTTSNFLRTVDLFTERDLEFGTQSWVRLWWSDGGLAISSNVFEAVNTNWFDAQGAFSEKTIEFQVPEIRDSSHISTNPQLKLIWGIRYRPDDSF